MTISKLQKHRQSFMTFSEIVAYGNKDLHQIYNSPKVNHPLVRLLRRSPFLLSVKGKKHIDMSWNQEEEPRRVNQFLRVNKKKSTPNLMLASTSEATKIHFQNGFYYIAISFSCFQVLNLVTFQQFRDLILNPFNPFNNFKICDRKMSDL